jgi:hypothetical protein
MKYKQAIERLKSHNVLFEKGLSQDEVSLIEAQYQIVFPPDLRELLQMGLPISKGFVNWRNFSDQNVASIKEKLNWPLEGIFFDMEHNSFWYDAWGTKPGNAEEAKRICETEYQKVPRLIPIFSHRYIPSYPNECNNPIFSVYQTDIIYYGENLEEYFKVEFHDKEYKDIDFNRIKSIEFWTDITG